MNNIGQCESAAVTLHDALAKTACLGRHSTGRDALWLVVQATICTRGRAIGTAMGSATEQDIGGEDAREDELLAAMTWLSVHEEVARLMDADHLFRRLRGVAVGSRYGSARTTQADHLHGMTGVASGRPIRFVSEAVAS